MPPKVSVIIPVYNVEQYLRQCLDSAMNQTLRDIEIICVDDGSTDSSGAILDEYAIMDSRFVVVHQANGGLSDARNSGIVRATGDYIVFLDSDDFCEVTLCEKTIQLAEQSGADMVQFLYRIDSDDGVVLEPEAVKYSVDSNDRLLMERLVPNVWLYLYRRSFLTDNKLSFIKGIIFEDIPFTYPARYLANKIAFLPEKLYCYRVSTEGLSNGAKKQSNYLMLPKVYNLMIEELQRLGCSEETLQTLYLRKLNELYFAWTIKDRIKKSFAQSIGQSLSLAEKEIVCQSGLLDNKKRIFYLSVIQKGLLRLFYFLRYKSIELWDWFVERLYYRSSLYKKHEDEVQWLKAVIENHDEFFKMRENNRE
ncbi:MAG: glycosyltransferase [Thermoguttaceae bacterium]|nr:glycosyltransferase [Thermoguttaceae bacterium]MBQ6614892.1 glycosyltransferase [Thermoguttaceae bacterium]